MRLLEVIGVALAGVEVALPDIRHARMLQRPELLSRSVENHSRSSTL
jgi:hypothetical protein